MFKIQGSDQKEYGPVTADAMRQWIAERRVNGRTLVQAEGTTGWKPLAEFPEFAAALAAGGPPPVPGSASAQPGVPAGPAKTSGMAIASLVCGLMGCLGITAIAGLILGIVAQVRISRSQGRLKGGGLAIAGICVSGVMLISIPILAGLMLPALSKAKGRAQTITCVGNMKQLALAVRLYSNDNKDTYPQGDSWCDAVQTYVGNPRVFQCRADTTGQRCSYAINRNVAGMKEDKVDRQTVLLFEIRGGWNIAGGRELLNTSRHGSRLVVVAFADGSVQQMPASSLGTLRWNP